MKNIKALSYKILRRPILPLSESKKIPSDPIALNEFVDNLYSHKIFAEAVYLSSPSLYAEWGKIVKGQKDRGKMNESILKYYLRSFSNTVPFGLFSSYSILGSQDCKGDFIRFSNIDMDYLSKLIEYLNRNEIIRKLVAYRLNNTIYKIGNHYRYIEPKFASNELTYTLSSIECDELLDLLINNSEEEFYYDDVRKAILDLVEGVTDEDVNFYIDQLIDSKIYISCFEIKLNEEDLLQQIVCFYTTHKFEIDKDNELKNIFGVLKEVGRKLKELDLEVFNTKDSYEAIYKELDKIGIAFEDKYIVNSNLRKNIDSLQGLDKMDSGLEKLLEILPMLSKSSIVMPSFFVNFKKNFYSRYEDQEVPLLEAIDTELGVGYNTNRTEDAIFSDLIDDINMPIKSAAVRDIKIEPAIYNFWMNAFMKNKSVIDLERENLSIFSNNQHGPDGTFSITYSYAGNKLYLKYAGGVSGSKLIGRFSNNDLQVRAVMNEITDFERSAFKNKVTAEIIHLPASRAGNILMRKTDREAEISIIAKTSEKSLKIDANDLMISMRRNKIILRSKKGGKEIIPFLSSAQNYHYNSLPVYHFLCDLQTQDRVTNLSINYGGFAVDALEYLPRIIYGENLILQKAVWIIKLDNFKKIEHLKQHLDFLKVPQFFYITGSEEDKMIIDKENPNLLKILFNEIDKHKLIRITECIYNMDEEEYANEFISVFTHSSSKMDMAELKVNTERQDEIKRTFIYGAEWIYFKIYTGRVTADDLLLDAVSKIADNLVSQKAIDKWFFIRYNDPDFHLRVRFHLTDTSRYNEVSREVYLKINQMQMDNKVWKVDLSTYKRELERYNWRNIENSETIFFIDSVFTIKMLRALKSNKNNRVWFYVLKSIDDFFTAFNVGLQDRQDLMHKMFESFWIEHGSEKSVKKDIDLKFRAYEKDLKELFDSPPSDLSEFYLERLNELKKIEFDGESKVKLHDLIWSYIHMHVNRFVASNPRFHELIMYGILEKIYKKQIGINKYSTKNVKDETYQTA